jgi:putative transposase
MRTALPCSPESNGMAKAFFKTFKRDYVCLGNLKNTKTLVAKLPMWLNDYNEKAPHKDLKMLSPREFFKEPKRVR